MRGNNEGGLSRAYVISDSTFKKAEEEYSIVFVSGDIEKVENTQLREGTNFPSQEKRYGWKSRDEDDE